MQHTFYPILRPLEGLIPSPSPSPIPSPSPSPGPSPVPSPSPSPSASMIGDSIVYALTTTTEVLSTTESDIAFDTVVQNDAATFSASSGTVTVKEDGTYLIIDHLAVDDGGAGSNRTSGESFVHINNTLVQGCYTDGFLRRASSDNEWSDTGIGIYELSANDTINIRKLRINANGSDGRVVGNVTTNTPAKTAVQVVRIDENAATCILEGSGADTSTLLVDDVDTDQNWTTQTRLDSGYSHTSGTSDITIADIGTYLVCYSNSWARTVDSSTRTGVYERLLLDGSTLSGSWANNYIRGSQNGESILRGNNSCCTLIRTSAINEVLKLVSAIEGGGGGLDCDRLPLKSQIAIYKIDSADTFKVVSNSVESIGSSTPLTLTYDNTGTSTNWTDPAFSLASNQVTVPTSKHLIIQGVTSDVAVSARVSPFQWPRVNSVTDEYYSTGSAYSRNAGSMQRTSMNFASILETGNVPIDCRNMSQATSASMAREANTGGFCGIDLLTL